MEAEIAFRMLDLLYWKLVHNALPVKEKLVKRQIYIFRMCTFW